MDTTVADRQDGLSDYGSDFTPDEEEILIALLHQAPEQDDGPNTDPDLLLKDTDDHERPRGARVPRRQGQQIQANSNLSFSQTSVTIQLDSGNNCPANSTFCAILPSYTSTD